MAAHRWWRINIFENGSGYCGIHEIEMRETVGGPDVCNGGTPSASSTVVDNIRWPLGMSPANAFDNNTTSQASFWCGALIQPCWISYQFQNPVAIAEIMIMARLHSSIAGDTDAIVAAQTPVFFSFQWSDDGTYWNTTRYERSVGWTVGEQRVFLTSPRNPLVYPFDYPEIINWEIPSNKGTIGTNAQGTVSPSIWGSSGFGWKPNTANGVINGSIDVSKHHRSNAWANFKNRPVPLSLISRDVPNPNPIIAVPCFYGNGKVEGVVTADGFPIVRRVLLIERMSRMVVQDGWSDKTGKYRFDHIDANVEYMVFGEDYTRNYNSVVANYVKPERM